QEVIDGIIDKGNVAQDPPRAGSQPAPMIQTAEGAKPAGFIPPVWFNRLQFALTNSAVRGASMFGPRGSGKTTAIHALAKMLGVKLITFQAAAGNGIDDLVGQRDLIDGKTVFTPGPLPKALEEDCWLLCEEANVMHPGTWSKMNTLLDGSGDSL